MTQKPKQEAEPEVEATGFELFRDKLRLLYHGSSPAAVRFQFSVLIVDVAILAFFIASPLLWDSPTYLYVDYSIAALMFADLAARMLASTDITRWLRQPAGRRRHRRRCSPRRLAAWRPFSSACGAAST